MISCWISCLVMARVGVAKSFTPQPLNPAFLQRNNIPQTTMASARKLVTTEVRGGKIGAEFNDFAHIQNIETAAISRIIVRHDVYIHSLTVRHFIGKCPWALTNPTDFRCIM